jgi:GRAM domain
MGMIGVINIFLRTFWKASLFFGLIMALYLSIRSDWQTGLLMGLRLGLLFGLLAGVFVAYQAKGFTENRPLLPNEKLIKEGGANHFIKMESVGGWIYLTDSRLYFKSHCSNIQNHDISIALEEIVKVEKVNTFGVIPNQLRLTLRSGKIERFVVSAASEWVNGLRKLIVI